MVGESESPRHRGLVASGFVGRVAYKSLLKFLDEFHESAYAR